MSHQSTSRSAIQDANDLIGHLTKRLCEHKPSSVKHLTKLASQYEEERTNMFLYNTEKPLSTSRNSGMSDEDISSDNPAGKFSSTNRNLFNQCNFTIDYSTIIPQNDEISNAIDFIGRFLDLNYLCFWRFCCANLDSSDKIEKYSKISVKLSNAVHFLMQENEKIIQLYNLSIGKKLSGCIDLLDRMREELGYHLAAVTSGYSKILDNLLTKSCESKEENNRKFFHVRIPMLFDMTQKNQKDLVKFQKVTEICHNLGNGEKIIEKFCNWLNVCLIGPAVDNSKLFKFLQLDNGNTVLKIEKYDSPDDQKSAESSLKFFKKIFPMLLELCQASTHFENIFNRQIWAPFIDQVFYGPYYKNLSKNINFFTTLYPLYEDFEKSLNNKKYLKYSEESYFADRKKWNRNELLEKISSLAKSNNFLTLVEDPCLVNDKLIEAIFEMNKYPLDDKIKTIDLKVIKSLSQDYDILIDDVKMSKNSFRVVQEYFKIVNRAIENIKDDKSEGLFDLLLADQILTTYLNILRHRVNLESTSNSNSKSNNDLFQNMTQINQIITDCNLIIFASNQFLTQSSISRNFKTNILVLFKASEINLDYQNFVSFLTSQIFDREQKEIDGFFDLLDRRVNGGSSLGEINCEQKSVYEIDEDVIRRLFSYLFKLIDKFIGQKNRLFIRTLDMVIEAFIRLILLETKLLLESTNIISESVDTILTASRAAEKYLNETHQNKFLKMAFDRFYNFKLKILKPISCHLTMTSAKYHKIVKTGISSLYFDPSDSNKENNDNNSFDFDPFFYQRIYNQTGVEKDHLNEMANESKNDKNEIPSYSTTITNNQSMNLEQAVKAIGSFGLLKLMYLSEFIEANRKIYDYSEADISPLNRYVPGKYIKNNMGCFYNNLTSKTMVFDDGIKNEFYMWFFRSQESYVGFGREKGYKAIGGSDGRGVLKAIM